MKLVGRIPVEPLDDERWTNIERRIVAGTADALVRPARESRWHLAALGVAAAAVLVVGAGVIGWKARGAGEEPRATVAATAPLEIKTDRERSTIDIGDASIASDPASAYTVTRPEGGVLVAMARGRVELEVGKRGDRPPLVVRAGDTDVIVVGTHFSVDFGDGKGDVDVRVTEGVVRVRHAQQETRVAAGEAWTTKRGQVAIAELERIAAQDAVRASDIEIETTVPDVGLKPRQPVKPPGGDRPDRTSTEKPDRPTQPATGVKPPVDAALDLRTAIERQPLMPALDVGTSKPEEALAEYETRSKTYGREGEYAWYSKALLLARRGRIGEAQASLEGFVRRFEGQRQFPEIKTAALWLRVRVRCLAKIDDQCRQAAYTYVSQAPEGPAREVAERITVAQ